MGVMGEGFKRTSVKSSSMSLPAVGSIESAYFLHELFRDSSRKGMIKDLNEKSKDRFEGFCTFLMSGNTYDCKIIPKVLKIFEQEGTDEALALRKILINRVKENKNPVFKSCCLKNFPPALKDELQLFALVVLPQPAEELALH